MVQITFSTEHRTVTAPAGKRLLDVMRQEGICIDAPCGGRGTCGKCRVSIDHGGIQLACRYTVETDITVDTSLSQLTDAANVPGGISPLPGFHENSQNGNHGNNGETAEQRYVAAVDVGTTTVVCYLLRASDGMTAAVCSCTNPQAAYGADVVSRINEAISNGSENLTACIRQAVDTLLKEAASSAGILPDRICAVSIAGNTCMHHLFLGLDTKTLAFAPYRPAVTQAVIRDATALGLHIHPDAEVYFPPNVAGFVGGDTVACMVSARPDLRQDWTLLLDIGTNGEIVLGCKERLIACSAAAGPAFEGAGISCGMRGSEGAISHARWSDGAWELETVGGKTPVGICGSGLLDIAAALLESGQMDDSGLLTDEGPVVIVPAQTPITVTQKDIRALQLAKAAIRSGIQPLCESAGIRSEEIKDVLLAGAFGSTLSPDSACAIGLIPQQLRGRIHVIGNAAGEGAKRMVLHRSERACAEALAARTEYIELAALPQFQDIFIDALNFPEQ